MKKKHFLPAARMSPFWASQFKIKNPKGKSKTTTWAVFCFLIFNFSFLIGFTQNIGINTDGSAAEAGVMLDVKGTNPLTTTAAQNVFQIKSFDANGLKLRMILGTNSTVANTYGGLEVYDVANSAYRALALQPNGGNVGIGTISPTDALQVVGNSKLGGVMVYANQAAYVGSDNNPALYRTLGGSTYPFDAAGNLVIQPSTNSANKDIVFASGNGTPTAKVVIQGGGNVGIGTPIPAGRIEIVAADGARMKFEQNDGELYITGKTAGSNARLLLVGSSAQGAWAQYGNGTNYWAVGCSGSDLWPSSIASGKFFIHDNNLNLTRMVIDGSGNVGINQNSPAAKLEVDGTSGSTIKIVDGNTPYTGKVLTADAAGQGSWQPLSTGCMTQKVLEYTTAGSFTWTWPATCTVVNVECWGGGGGGSAGQDNGGGATAKGGGGGGSGAYIIAYNVPVTGNITVTVGAGGAGTTTNGANGTTGGSSSFGVLVVAPGGPGGGNPNACSSGGGLYGTTVTCGVAGTFVSFVNGAAASGGGGNNGSTGGDGYAGADFKGFGTGGAAGLNGGGAGSGGGAGGKGNGGAGGTGINVGTGTNGGNGGVAAGGGGGGGNQSGGAAGNGGNGGVGYVKVTWWE